MCSRHPDGPRRRPQSGERGVALVIALLVFAISAALLVAMQRDFDLNYRRGANSFIAQQSWSYLRGAEELAALALQLDHDADLSRETPRDDLTEVWAQPSAPYPLDEGGWLYGNLEDLQGRFNLNSLAAQPGDGEGPKRYSPAQQLFIRLLQALEGLEMDQFQAMAIADSVADWIDADNEPRLNGAEDSFYVGQQPAYRAANRTLVSPSELRAVANVTPELYLALRPLVSVWPEEPAAINIHTAPLPVLRALNVDDNLEPLPETDAQALLQQRQEAGFSGIEEFLSQPMYAGAATGGLSSLLGESSKFFLLASRVEIADREQRLYSVLRREAREVDVLQRINASLYDMPVQELGSTR
jgi:general secretion pathway protein K